MSPLSPRRYPRDLSLRLKTYSYVVVTVETLTSVVPSPTGAVRASSPDTPSGSYLDPSPTDCTPDSTAHVDFRRAGSFVEDLSQEPGIFLTRREE